MAHYQHLVITSQQALEVLPVVERDLETARQERRQYEALIKRWKHPWYLCGVIVGALLLPPLALWYLMRMRERISQTRQSLLRLDRRIAFLEAHLFVIAFQVELAKLPDETFLRQRSAIRSRDSHKPGLPRPSRFQPDGTPVWSFEPDEPDPVNASV